ncbi:SMI1/KNR4 family protein [Actinokineospora sp. 24-640]
MRVVLAIFLIGGLVIATAYVLGVGLPAPDRAPAVLASGAPSSTAATTPTPRVRDCAVGGGPDRVVAVPAEVATRVDQAWERVERWLADTVPAEVTWNPPASDAAIVRAQRAAGVAFPPDLVASLRRHDGVRAGGFTFPPFYAPMSTGEIAADARKLCAHDAGWDGAGVPFARDRGGWYLYLDPAGRVAEHAPGTAGGPRAATLAELLDMTADLLEGRRTDTYLPAVGADGVLSWRLR